MLYLFLQGAVGAHVGRGVKAQPRQVHLVLGAVATIQKPIRLAVASVKQRQLLGTRWTMLGSGRVLIGRTLSDLVQRILGKHVRTEIPACAAAAVALPWSSR